MPAFDLVPRSTVVYPSVARTATPSPVELDPVGARALAVRIKSTAITATPSVVFNIEAFDPAAGDWILVLASVAVATNNADITMKVDDQLTAAANTIAKAYLYERMRVRPVHGDADSITYTVSAHYVH